MKTRKFLLLFLALTVLVTICSCDRKDPAQSETTTVATETTVAIESVETTTEPVQTTTEPVETTTQPVETTTQPVETTTKPVETTTKPVETTTKPVETTTKPVETTTQPVETTTKPVETTVTTGPVGPVDPEEPHEHKYTNWKTIRKATCSTSGKKVGTCTCGATKSITVAALGHTFDSEKVLTAPTCIEPGSKEVICSTCGHVEITSIPTINHTEEIIPAKAYTCTEAGMSEGKICAVCQTVLVAPEVVPAQHAFTNYVSDHNASCTVDGTETAKCDFCGNVTDTRIAVGSAKGHTPGEKLEYNNNEHYQVCTVCAVPFNAVAHDAAELCSCGYQKPAEKCQHKVTLTYVPAKASTCLAKGNSAYFICPDCSAWFEDKDATKEIVDHTKVYLEVADHVELVIVAEKPATCFEKGTTAHVICQTCEMVLKQGISLPMLDHTTVIDEAVAPTCIATGKTAGEHCSVCSTVLIAQVTVPATGVHDYEIVTTPATCMANGSAVYDCKNCDAHIEETVVATGHKIADDAVWTVVNDETTGEAIVTRKDGETCLYIGKQYTSCSVCGEKVEKEYEVVKHQHQLTATTPATCQATGEKVYTCVCGNTYTETIEINPNAHDWTAPADNKSVCRIEGCVATKIVVDNTQSTTAGLNKDTLTGAKDNDLEVNLQDATVKMDSNIVNDLGTQGKDVELSAGKLDETGRDEVASKLNEETQKLLAEKPIFDFNLKVDNQKVEFNGKMLVTLPYTLAENEDPEHVVVAYIDDNGGVTLIPATYFEKNGEGFVSFETTHFSVFAPVVVSGADLCEVYGHKLYEVTVNATCLTAGYTNRYCSVEGCGYAELGINAVPAIGHTFVDTITPATCKSQGYTTHVCSACAYTVVDTFTPFADHAMTVTAVVAPTCMAEGYSVEKCSVCEYERKTAFVPAIDHVWGEAVVTKEETCAEQGTLTATCTYEGCTATLVSVIPAKGHVAKATEAKAPTCTEDGHTKGYVCETCGEVLVAATVLPATGHVELIIARVKPTCVAVGSTQGMSCAVCGEIIVAVEEIPMIAHQKIPFGKIDPTCTTPGYEHGEKCSMCGEIFVATVEIPALGHKEEVYAAAVAATCTETGLTEGKKCSVCGEILKKQEIIPALGHTEEVFAAAVAATCTETGLTAGTKCSVCDTVLKAQETVPATGHTEVELSAKAPTCTATGLTAGIQCSVCNTILKAQETVPTLAHTEEVFAAAVSATCTETGLTAGIKCSVCNTILKAQETVPATGHSYKNSVCSVCGNITDGYVIYEENFDEYTNSNDIEAVLHTIGWTKLTKEKDGVYNETDAEFAIIDGRLYYDNYDAKTIEGDIRVRGKDGYYQIDVLNQEYMKPFVEGKYSLQYDLEYVDAKNASRYAVIITECSADGQAYNSFHFRLGGYASCQAHFYGSWKTFDAFDPATDLYSGSQAGDADEAATMGTPIVYKLLGRYCDTSNKGLASQGAKLFENIIVTIKLQWEPGVGHHVYMKTADMADFVKVSEPHVDADGMDYLEKWEGYAVQFKLGATIDGYIDNIMMWVGWGEKPKSHTVAEWTIVQDPGCGKNGLKSGVCTECGETVTKSVAGIPHDVSKWEVTQEPTCTVKGKSEGVCANCGEITVRTITTLDHVHTVWETTTEATCVEKGVESSYCDYGCGTVKTRSIDVIAHKYVDGICSGCGKQGVIDGTLIYAESFDYADDSNTESVLKTIGWTKLTKEKNGVYNETDAEFAIIDGRLYYDNYDQDGLRAARDGYYQIDVLNQEYMKPFVEGKYSLQYDLEYTAAKDRARYATIITECSADGQCYNSFMFRVGGYGNNQCHLYGSWKTYDQFDPATDLYAASTATNEEDFATKGTTIIYKLLGQHYNANVCAFNNVPVTVKLQWEPGMGHHVYMKTADMVDFVKVSEPSLNADGPKSVGTWDGYAVQFKFGAAIDGYIDNIMMWTGWGDMLLDGHYISGIWTVETESTCNTRGREYATCSKCGEKVYRELPLGKHEYTNWTVTVQPTCSAYGVEIGTCACGATETKQIEKLEHTFEGESCTLCGRGYNYDLKFTLDKNKTYYTVSGIGSCTDTEIYIPATYKNLPVLEIASSAFAKNTNITKVVIADGITTINSSAFANCTSLTKLILPETLTTCNNTSFVTSSNAYIFNVDEQGGKYLGTADNPYFMLYAAPSSSKITEYTPHADTKFIGYSSFNNRDYLQSVTIPEGVSIIATYAFGNCDSLKTVSIPSTATKIGTQLFAYCTALETVTIHADNPVYVSVNNCIINKGTKTLTVGCVSSVIPADGSVTVIGNSAFQYVPITSITVPEGIERIEAYAFRYCDALTEIVLPSTLSNLGNGVFGSCEALTSIQVAEANANFRAVDNCLIRADGALMFTATNVIPEGVTAIGPYAFYAMDSLTTVNIPTSVTSIGNYAFCNCKNLTSVVIPDSVTTIGADAFDGCNNLAEVNIPDSVTTIGSNAFYACSSLTEIVIPEGVTNITNYTFRNCSSLTTVTIPASVTKIGNYAFDGCTALTTVNYSGTAEQWSKISVGSNNAPLTNLQPVIHSYNWVVTTEPTCAQTGLMTGTCGECGAIATRVIPALAHTYTWVETATPTCTQTGLETGTCGVCGATATRVIPTIAHTYTWVETAAPTCTQTGLATGTCACGATETKQLEKLEHTFVNESCTCGRGYNYDLAFSLYKDENGEYYGVAGIGKCTDTEIYIPATYNDVPVREIFSGAFRNNTQITKVVIPNGVTIIGDSAFNGCTALTSLILPETLTSTYYGLSNLPDAVYTVEENGGRYLGTVTNPYFLLADVLSKSQVTEFVANEATKLVGNEAFWNCNNLQSIVIPEGVIAISDNAFALCSELKTVSLPSTAVSLGNYLFAYCPALETVTVHADNPVYKSAGNCIINKESKTLVVGCVSSVIPADGSVTVIGVEAFANIPFSTFVIPEGIVEIGGWAFEGCNDLTELALPSTLTSVGSAAFVSCDSLKSFTVAEGNTTFYAVDNCLLRVADDALMVSPSGIIPSEAKAIGPYAFFNNNDLKSIVIPEGITAIDEYAFSSCYNLTSVTLPESLISIGDYAFRYCEELLAIELPGKLQSIGTRAFSNCYSLTEIVIPEGVTTINNSTFRNCSSLTTVTIPASVTKIGNYAFNGCNALTTVNYSGTAEQWSKISVGSNNAPLTNLQPVIHSYNWVVITAPTCTQTGLETGTCGECGATATRVIPTLAHTYTWVETAPPTCTQTGLETGTCGVCGATATRVIPTIAHTYTWIETATPTCTQTGLATGTCGVCGATETKQLEKLEHTFVNESCTVCDRGYNYDLVFTRYKDENGDYYYSVAGIGKCTDTEIYIPATYNDVPVREISYNAFAKNTNITKIVIPNGVTIIGDSAFNGCTALTSLILPETLTSTYYGLSNLPDAVYTVEENGGRYLGTVTNPYFLLADVLSKSQVTEFVANEATKLVGNEAFSGCNKLQSIVIPEGVIAISDRAFNNCSVLKSVSIPSTAVSLGNYLFANCPAMETVTVHSDNPVYKSVGNCIINKESKTLVVGCVSSVIPADGSVTVIGVEAFANIPFSTFVIPEGIVEIGDWAFRNCYNLTEIRLPSTLTKVGSAAFVSCDSLKSFTVAEGNTTFYAVDNCLLRIADDALMVSPTGIIPSATKAIGPYAFFNNNDLKSIVIPEGITAIDEYAFASCYNLTSVTLPESLISIGDYAFCYCEELLAIELPGKLQSIGTRAFSNCQNLTEVIIPDSVTTMGSWIFEQCYKLEKVVLPANLTTIENGMFANCQNLKEITIPASVTRINGNAFYNCDNLTEVIIPDSVTTMDAFIFEQCDKLEKVVLPANLTTIGSGMFANCQNLKEVTIPASVTRINSDAFYNCNALTTVNYGGTTEQWAKITIYGHNDPLLKAEIKAHSFTVWTQTKAPTCSEYGQETATCDDGCGMVSTRMIAKLPHTYENEVCVVCGTIQYSEGLEYRLSYDNNKKPYYTVVGIGTCTDTKLRIPGTYEDIPVTHIGGSAFNSSTITSVWLDKGITTLNVYAFNNCTSLTEFIAADTLTSIADMALPESLKGTTVYENGLYLGSTKNPYMILTDMVDDTVTSFTIHADTKFIGDYALANAHNLESLVIPSGVLSLGREALGYCTALTSVTLPETLVALRPYAFRYCSALTQITLPNSLREIAYYVFEDCIALTALQIPAGVTSIEESVVSGCNALTSLTVDENNTVYHSTNNCVINTSNKALVMGCSISVIPDYVEEIYDRAFNRCDDLTSVTLPASLTKLGASAFEQCNNLTSLTVDPANSVFYSTGNCVIEKATGKLVCVAPEFVLPNDGSITSMEGWIFDHRTFEEFTLPEGLVSISQCAFQGCRNLKTLTIPASVTQIDRSAFQNCTNLTTVYYGGTESQWAAMTIESYNDHLLGANIVFNYTPEVNQ